MWWPWTPCTGVSHHSLSHLGIDSGLSYWPKHASFCAVARTTETPYAHKIITEHHHRIKEWMSVSVSFVQYVSESVHNFANTGWFCWEGRVASLWVKVHHGVSYPHLYNRHLCHRPLCAGHTVGDQQNQWHSWVQRSRKILNMSLFLSLLLSNFDTWMFFFLALQIHSGNI